MNKAQPATLAIVIVNWNTGHQLRDCVSSLRCSEVGSLALDQVVIVDNASTDESLLGVDQLDVPTRIIRNESNRGFAAACNQGAEGVTTDYLLFLNPDTRLFSSSLSEPIRFMERPENAHVGICGIRLLDESGETSTSAARFPTLRVMIGSVFRLSRLLPRVFPSHFLTANELRESGPVDQVIGAYFLIRRHVFEQCRGFDERFFVYFEEVDLSLRALRLGFTSYLLSSVSAFHKGGGASERVRATRLFYSLRSRLQYAKKHYSAPARIALVLVTMLELPLRVAHALVKPSWADVANTSKAYGKLIADLVRRS